MEEGQRGDVRRLHLLADAGALGLRLFPAGHDPVQLLTDLGERLLEVGEVVLGPLRFATLHLGAESLVQCGVVLLGHVGDAALEARDLGTRVVDDGRDAVAGSDPHGGHEADGEERRPPSTNVQWRSNQDDPYPLVGTAASPERTPI